jgi:hypothetical protein
VSTLASLAPIVQTEAATERDRTGARPHTRGLDRQQLDAEDAARERHEEQRRRDRERGDEQAIVARRCRPMAAARQREEQRQRDPAEHHTDP